MNREECLAVVEVARQKGERPDLRWANLSGANLRRADLRRADLSGADLRDTRATAGQMMRYDWYLVPGDDGPLLSFGCERHPLSKWPDIIDELCAEHEPDDPRYPAALRALVDFCAAFVASQEVK